ncbi:hypothetical protein KW800_00460 [Candidatus Parcubacteria bacterium]|nr:hypothetical protein [Candidatus Parcubacteria bacterium]
MEVVDMWALVDAFTGKKSTSLDRAQMWVNIGDAFKTPAHVPGFQSGSFEVISKELEETTDIHEVVAYYGVCEASRLTDIAEHGESASLCNAELCRKALRIAASFFPQEKSTPSEAASTS